MYKTLKTKRLTLKNIGYEDIDFIYHLFTNDFINKYLFDAEPLTSKEEAKAIIDFYIKTAAYKNHRYILINDRQEKMGTIGFHSYDEKSNTIGIGYDLLQRYNHQGYMKEALAALLDYLAYDLKIEHIQATIYPENYSSIKLVKSFGFMPFCHKIEWFRSEPYEHIVYQLTIMQQELN